MAAGRCPAVGLCSKTTRTGSPAPYRPRGGAICWHLRSVGGAGSGTRTRKTFRPVDFKSTAYAISPPRLARRTHQILSAPSYNPGRSHNQGGESMPQGAPAGKEKRKPKKDAV